MTVSELAAASRSYVFGKMRRVEGYLDPCDALVYQTVLLHQLGQGYQGGGVEIGVLYGRSFFLMRQLMPECRLLAIDNFNTGRRADGSSAQKETFLRLAERFGGPLEPDLVVEGDSTEMEAHLIAEKLGPVRFFSIDGGHHLRHVRHDSALAAEVLSAEGVIVFDDFCNFEWPEVSAGAFDFLRQHPEEFAPFAVTPKKLYVCRSAVQAAYLASVREAPGLSGFVREGRGLLGTQIIAVKHPMRKRLVYEALSRVGLGFVAGLLYPSG
ncbi:MAG: class I SAM-dependent methyltransferase [Pseudomonadota bacterium]